MLRPELRQRNADRFTTRDAIVERAGRDGSPRKPANSDTKDDYACDAETACQRGMGCDQIAQQAAAQHQDKRSRWDDTAQVLAQPNRDTNRGDDQRDSAPPSHLLLTIHSPPVD